MKLRDEAGFTLTELLVAMALTIIVLTATLDVLDTSVEVSQQNVRANDARENARLGIDALARGLRNAAGPGAPTAIERATPFDLVIDKVDPQGADGASPPLRRVRYCLDQSNPKNGRLWEQAQVLPNPLSSAAACPQNSYGTQRMIVDNIVNGAVTRPGTDSALFTYDVPDLNQITSIGATLYADTNVDRPPAETRIRTSVRLRNRNRAPVASFTAAVQGQHVLLNGGSSSDPDGQEVQYYWSRLDGTSWTQIGTGQTLDYRVPSSGSQSFRLTVWDFNPGGLSNTSAAQTVLIP